jgi:hypothetical protein
MDETRAAADSLSEEFCRIVLVATLEGRHATSIFNILHGLDPSLTRDEFDRRMTAYRDRLWERLLECNVEVA